MQPYVYLCIVLLGLALLAAAYLLYKRVREGFANAIRTKIRCAGRGWDDPANTTKILLRGFNYSIFPSWFSGDVRIIPYQFDWDSFNTVYSYSIFSQDFLDGCIILETSEDIEPIVDVLQEDGSLLQVQATKREDSQPGYIRWDICL